MARLHSAALLCGVAVALAMVEGPDYAEEERQRASGAYPRSLERGEAPDINVSAPHYLLAPCGRAL